MPRARCSGRHRGPPGPRHRHGRRLGAGGVRNGRRCRQCRVGDPADVGRRAGRCTGAAHALSHRRAPRRCHRKAGRHDLWRRGQCRGSPRRAGCAGWHHGVRRGSRRGRRSGRSHVHRPGRAAAEEHRQADSRLRCPHRHRRARGRRRRRVRPQDATGPCRRGRSAVNAAADRPQSSAPASRPGQAARCTARLESVRRPQAGAGEPVEGPGQRPPRARPGRAAGRLGRHGQDSPGPAARGPGRKRGRAGLLGPLPGRAGRPALLALAATDPRLSAHRHRRRVGADLRRRARRHRQHRSRGRRTARGAEPPRRNR